MAASAQKIACFALLMSISALQVPSFIDKRGTSPGTTTTTTAAVTASASASSSASAPPPLFDNGALKAVAMLALAGMDAALIVAAVMYSRHTNHAAAVGNWRVTQLAFFVLCVQVGVLEFVVFVQKPGAAGDAAARALGMIGTSAARALPFIASVAFFLGITLIYAHVGNAGEAAGGAVAGNGTFPAPATVRLLADLTLGAALACLMSTTLALFYNNTE